jgi:Ca-activated chloride channel family protein
MRIFAALIALALATQKPVVQDPHPFQSAIEVTTIAATVFDKDGKIVAGLERDAFEIFEDGEPQRVTQFTNERVPIGLGVLLDTSDSMYGKRIQDARATVDRFLFGLLAPTDEFFIVAFNHQVHLLTEWTNTPDVVRHALDGIKPWGATAVYDAVLRALPIIDRRSRQRAAILIISDGDDTASDASIREVRSALVRSDAFVYAIAIDPKDRRAINAKTNPEALREITNESGGRTEVVSTTDELSAAAARIAEELNNQYVLGYTSPKGADGKFHSIRVRATGGDYRVRARNGYVATPVDRRHGPG